MKLWIQRARKFKRMIRFSLLIAVIVFVLNACSAQLVSWKTAPEVVEIYSEVHLQEFESTSMQSVANSIHFQSKFKNAERME